MDFTALFPRRARQINLLPHDAFETSIWGVILSWAMTFGKWAVILTQLVVTGVFLTRFGYDRQLTDLRKKIAQQSAIILSYKEMENNFELAQKRVDFATPIIEENDLLVLAVDKLQKVTPKDIWIEKLALDPNMTTITAKAGSINGFSYLIKSLTQEKVFSSVSINNLQDNAEGAAKLKFDLSLGKIEIGEPKK